MLVNETMQAERSHILHAGSFERTDAHIHAYQSLVPMVGLAGSWFVGAAGAPGAALQHTTRGKAKCRGRRRTPLERGAGARRHGGLACRHFALPLLYAERARHCYGGMMGGAGPRAAVRASSRRDSRAVGERAGAGGRARLSRQRDARGSGAVQRGRSLARRDACTAGGAQTVPWRDAAALIGSAAGEGGLAATYRGSVLVFLSLCLLAHSAEDPPGCEKRHRACNPQITRGVRRLSSDYTWRCGDGWRNCHA